MALFALALLLRVGLAVQRASPDDGDQRLYRELATSMADGHGYVLDGAPKTTVHPLLPMLHATAIRVFGNAERTGIMLTLLIGSLLPLVAGRTVAMMLGFESGLASGALLAVEPHHALASMRLEPDLLAALLCFWLAGLLWRRAWSLAGVVVGLGYLTRPELLLLAPAAAVLARMRGASVGAVVRLLVTALAVSLVFLLFVHEATGRFALSGKDRWQYLLGVHQWRSGNQPLDPAAIPALREEIGGPLQHLSSNPREFFLGYGYRSGLYFRNLLRQLGFVLLPVAIFGALDAWRRSRPALACLVLPLVLLPVYPLVGTFFRHSFVAGSVLLALAGVGFLSIYRSYRARRAAAV